MPSSHLSELLHSHLKSGADSAQITNAGDSYQRYKAFGLQVEDATDSSPATRAVLL